MERLTNMLRTSLDGLSYLSHNSILSGKTPLGETLHVYNHI